MVTIFWFIFSHLLSQIHVLSVLVLFWHIAHFRNILEIMWLRLEYYHHYGVYVYLIFFVYCNCSADNVHGNAHHRHRSQALSHHTDHTHRPWGGWRRVGFAIALQTACVNISLTPISLLCAKGLAFSRNICIHLKLAVNINTCIPLAWNKVIKNSPPSLIAKCCDIRQYSILK